MALLLKKPRGLGSVRLVDASFIWTEPHSRRIKIKACVQKEVVSGAVLQQSRRCLVTKFSKVRRAARRALCQAAVASPRRTTRRNILRGEAPPLL